MNSLRFSKLNAHLVQGFVSGDIPTGFSFTPPSEKPVPIDSNGNPRIYFKDEDGRQSNGRGRLIAALDDLLTSNRVPEYAIKRLKFIRRDFGAFLDDISIHFSEDNPLFPLTSYRLFLPKHVVFYPYPTRVKFRHYRKKLIDLDNLVISKNGIPSELLDYLTSTESKLFAGKNNEEARLNVMTKRIKKHLVDPLVNIAIMGMLFTPEEYKRRYSNQKGWLDKESKQISADEPDVAERIEVKQNHQARLFPNSKDINLGNQWAIPQWISTQVNRGIRGANRTRALEQYKASGEHPRSRKSVFKVQNGDQETEFIFDKEKLAIETAEQFADQLMKLKDAKVLQTFFALMKWMNIKDTPVFRNIPISEIMELVLKPSGENKFNTAQRREFSEVLEYLANMSITVSYIGERKNQKTGKSKHILREETGVRLFRFMAEYSIRKEFQSIPKELLSKNLHFDKTVINRFSGEILPGNAHLFGKRGSVYFDSLLHLNANTDSKAIIMGFTLQTRFNQLTDKDKHVELDRPYLVDLCDYEKTNQTKPSQATKQLANNLDKLKQAGIISSYSGLTNNDTDRIKIFPPKAKSVA